MWDIFDIIRPTCNDHLSKGLEEWVILDESLEVSFSIGCDVHMVDGDVQRYLWSFEGCIVRDTICNQHLFARLILNGEIIVLEL